MGDVDFRMGDVEFRTGGGPSRTLQYKYEVERDENHWDTVRRLCEEVGWEAHEMLGTDGGDFIELVRPIPEPPTPSEKLSARHDPFPANRAQMTRAQYIKSLCAKAGVKVEFGEGIE